MKKQISCLLTVLVFSLSIFCQTESKKRSSGIDLSIAAGIHAPLGDFSSTHILGISLDVAPTRHSFGLMSFKKIAFTYNAGVTIYFGEVAMVSGYPYKYETYTFIHGFGGLLYNPVRKLSATLLAGPALGIYNGSTRFNIGARLEGSYYIKGNFSAGPLLNMMLEPGTDPLWSAGLKLKLDL